MSRTIITTPKAPKAPPSYSQAVQAVGLIFVSGTAPIDPATGKIVEGSIEVQVAQCLRNISAILEAAGSCLQKAVSATLIIADEDDFAAANEEWLNVVSDRSAGATGCQAARPHSGAEGLDRDDR